ncbi:MAG: V-type ATP synthase subunit E [Lachnospiraceae bacterium]|jgi:vacuolar-type H+-ATPase subunit E/Vma4|nr:V-type ATP synthase subunit E [Lachnospiraceae bacterium]
MEIEEKIAHLQNLAMTEARATANAMVQQHTVALEKVYDQHHEEAIRQSKLRIKAEESKAKQEKNMASSKASLSLKRELSKIQTELKDKLFEEVKQDVYDYMKTEEYTKLLIDYIIHAATFAKDDPITIYINPSDKDKIPYLEEQTGIKLTLSKMDFIGGVRAVLFGKNILIDNAFKGAIEREYQAFVFKGGIS